MALASLSIDLTIALAKFEGDAGKAAQIITRSSERMTAAARSVTNAFTKQQDAMGRTAAESLAVQAAQAGAVDIAQKLAAQIEQANKVRTGKAQAEGYTAASAAAQDYQNKLAALNAEEVSGLVQITQRYRDKVNAIKAQRESGAINDDGLKAALAGAEAQKKEADAYLRAARDKKAAELEVLAATQSGAVASAAATQKQIDAVNGLSASYRQQLNDLRALRDAGQITPAQFKAAGAELAAKQPAVQRRTAEIEEAQKVRDANDGISASYRQQLRDLEALLAKDKLTGPEFLQAKTSLVEKQPAFVSQQKQISEEKAAAAAVAEGVRLRANAFQALQARIEVLTTGYVKLDDAARQATQNDAEIEAGNRFIQNLNAQVFAIGKTREEKLRLEAASLGRSQQAEPIIRSLGQRELAADIEAQIVKTRELAQQAGLTKIQVLELRAAQQGKLASSSEALDRLRQEEAAYERLTKAAKDAEAAKKEKAGFAAKITEEIQAQQKLIAELGKTEQQVQTLRAAELGYGETLAAQIAQLAALKASYESLKKSKDAADQRKTDAAAFIAELVKEREEAGKTEEQLRTLKATRLGLNAKDSAPLIRGAADDKFIAEIDKEIAAEKRKAQAIDNTTAAVLRQRAAERGEGVESRAAGKIAELEQLAAANKAAATAAEQRKKAEAFIAEVNTRAAGINDNGTQKAISEQLALKAATLGVSKEVEEAIKKIGLLDGKTGQLGKSAFASRNQLLTLQYTISDVIASAGSGISPLTILLQQGGQVFDVFGGAAAQANGGFFKNFFGTIGAVLTPARLAIGGVTAALGVLGVAFFTGTKQSKEFLDTLVLTGNAAGLTEGRFNSLTRSVADSSEASVSQSREFAQALLATGEVGPKVFGVAAEAAVRYGLATGKTAKEVAQSFASMSRDATAWANENNKSLNLLTAAQLQQIKTLQDQGKAAEAQALIYEALSTRLKALEPNLGLLDKALIATKKGWADFWNAAYDVGRTETPEQKLAKIESRLASLRRQQGAARPEEQQAALLFGPEFKSKDGGAKGDTRENTELENQAAALRAQIKTSEETAKATAATVELNRKAADSVAFVAGTERRAKSVEALNRELEKARRGFADEDALAAKDPNFKPTSAAARKSTLDQIREDFKPNRSGASSNAETEAERLRKARLAAALKALEDNLTAQRTAQAFHQQELQAIYAAGSQSLEDYYAKRNASIAVGVARELETLASQRKALEQYRDLPTTSGSDRVKTQTEIDESGAKSVAIQLKAANDITLSNFEQAAAFKQLGQQVSDYRANLLQLTGDERAAAELRAQQQIKAARLLETQAASRRDVQTPGDVRRFELEPKVDVSGLEEALRITNDLAEVQRKVGIATADATRAEEEYLLVSRERGDSLVFQERAVFEIRSLAVSQLRIAAEATEVLADAERAAAIQANRVANPKILSDAADAALAYARALQTVDPATVRLRDATDGLAQSISQSGVNSLFNLDKSNQKGLDNAVKQVSEQRALYDEQLKNLRSYLAKSQDAKERALLQDQIRQVEEKRANTKVDRTDVFLKAIEKDFLRPILQQIRDAAIKYSVTEPLQKSLQKTFSDAASPSGDILSGLSKLLGIGKDVGSSAGARGFSAAKDTGLVVDAASSVTGASTDAAAATAATTAATGLSAVGTAATGAAPFISALGSEATTSALGVNAIGSESARSALFVGGLGEAATKALGSITLFSSALDAAAAKAAGSSAVGAVAAASAKGNAFTSTAVMAFAEGDRFARDGIFPFAKGGAFSHDAEPRHAQKFAAGGQFTNRVVSQPTYFRFKEGGRSRLGVMGEAGPEAVMPLKRGRGGQGVQSYNRDGSPGPLLSLIRGSNGSLGVRAFARGGRFERGVAVSAFSTGGQFAGEAAPAAVPPVRATTGNGNGEGSRGGGPRVVIENHGAEIQRREETGPDGQQQLRLIIRQAVEQSRNAVAADIASGTGPAGMAMKARGVNTGGSIPRRT